MLKQIGDKTYYIENDTNIGIYMTGPDRVCLIDTGSRGDGVKIDEILMQQGWSLDFIINTHTHIDHIGGFVGFVANDELMKHVKIKSVTYNFPQKQVLDTAPGAGDQNNIKAWSDRLEKTGATVYQARTGQKFYFGNAEIEMIFTYEDRARKAIEAGADIEDICSLPVHERIARAKTVENDNYQNEFKAIKADIAAQMDKLIAGVDAE